MIVKNKKIFKEKIFIHGFSNFMIFGMLITLLLLTFSNNFQSVFNSNTINAIYYGNRNSNKVCLMINVYWGTEYISEMLEVFDAYDVTTTFFIGGSWAENEPEKLAEIFNSGHEIGNHGYFHRDHDKLSYNQNEEEIKACHTIIKTNINVAMTLFAPPSGSYNKTTLAVANSLGYTTIMWSKDTIDWRDKDSDLVFSRATKNIAGGDLVLMHPTQHTLKALPQILDYYKGNNIVATTVTNVIS